MTYPIKIAVWLPISQEQLDTPDIFKEFRLNTLYGPRLGPWPHEIDTPYEREARGKRVLVPWPGRAAGPMRRPA